MKVIVPDASVLLKWVLPGPEEADTEAALALRLAAVQEDIRLIVPPLWLFEVGNTLARKFPKQAPALIDSILSFGLETVEMDSVWLEKTLALTSEFGVTFYDAAYHALAIVTHGTFITADRRYMTRTEKAGHVMHLGDWRSQ